MGEREIRRGWGEKEDRVMKRKTNREGEEKRGRSERERERKES